MLNLWHLGIELFLTFSWKNRDKNDIRGLMHDIWVSSFFWHSGLHHLTSADLHHLTSADLHHLTSADLHLYMSADLFSLSHCMSPSRSSFFLSFESWNYIEIFRLLFCDHHIYGCCNITLFENSPAKTLLGELGRGLVKLVKSWWSWWVGKVGEKSVKNRWKWWSW